MPDQTDPTVSEAVEAEVISEEQAQEIFYAPDRMSESLKDRLRTVRVIQKKLGMGDHISDASVEAQIGRLSLKDLGQVMQHTKGQIKQRLYEMLENPLYLKSLEARLILGTAPHVETLLLKSKLIDDQKQEETDQALGRQGKLDVTLLTPDELRRFENVLKSLRRKINQRSQEEPQQPSDVLAFPDSPGA